MKHRFGIKIAVIFSGVICMIIGTYFIAFRTVYDRHEYHLLAEESIHTLQTIKQSCMSLLETADNDSKIMLADEEIQNILNTGDIYSSPRNQSKLTNRIYGLLQFDQNITSVYFLDKKNQVFTIGGNGSYYPGMMEPSKMEWYEKVIKDGGVYILTPGEQEYSGISDDGDISLIRVYKNLDDFSMSGIIAVNIDVDAVRRTYQESFEQGTEEILFLDETNQLICRDGNELLKKEQLDDFTKQLKQSENGTFNESLCIGKEKYMISCVYMSDTKWSIVRVMPLDINQKKLSILTMNVVLIMFSTIFILLGTVLVSRMMTVPIQKMLQAMKQAEKGEFVKIHSSSFLHEFRYLFDGYNQLLDKINQLIMQTIEKQKTIRRIELNEMHEQMKPHFLYNTLDSIEALAMMDEKEKLCEIVEALGEFYRKSVSKGREMITIEDEMTIVMDYIKIMSIRFENVFESHILIEEGCSKYMIPKLTLQPIVENSIHHGLRERELVGNLWINIQKNRGQLHIQIIDDGIGFSEKVLSEIAEGKNAYQEKSFGLRGTIERLSLVYGDGFKYKVTSEGFVKTEISFYIQIKSLEGEFYEEIESNISGR